MGSSKLNGKAKIEATITTTMTQKTTPMRARSLEVREPAIVAGAARAEAAAAAPAVAATTDKRIPQALFYS